MKQPHLRAITPTWAQRIEVERQKEALQITGWGHVSDPFSSRDIPSEQQSKLDVLQRLRRYTLRHLGEGGGIGGIYQFADADDDEKLICFCGQFGPIWGEVRSEVIEGSAGTSTIIATQNMPRLRGEQRRFQAAVDLCAELNKCGRADHTVIAENMAELGIDRKNLSLIHMDILLRHKRPKINEWLDLGHWLFCRIINEYPPKLAPIDGQAIEIPEVCREGIRNALYFQLRLDYLAQRTIGTCLNCGNHFQVFKRGARACGETCRRALRNNKYWSENRDSINKKRRDDRARED